MRSFIRPVLGFAVAALLLVGLALPRRAHAEVVYAAKEYSHQGVVVMAEKIFLKKDKLWLRLRVINNTGKLLTIDKSQIQIKLPDGAVMSRAEGVFGKFAKPHILNAGLSHDLNVEYVIGEIPKPAALLFKQGFIVDGKSLPLPDYHVVPTGAN